MKKSTIDITERVWLYPGETAQWHFVTIPKKETAQINTEYEGLKRGWGSLPVHATIGTTTWKTSLFPDKKAGTYMLPLKALVRRREDVEAGDKVRVQLVICP